ncbi:hypothetical protein BDV93DRAFT_515376 [Ceratobasidium sp. AG-I]|nr:hypothetical protein BDV93DRAFT_515376 [Ceratobasidium sp. AG-I]
MVVVVALLHQRIPGFPAWPTVLASTVIFSLACLVKTYVKNDRDKRHIPSSPAGTTNLGTYTSSTSGPTCDMIGQPDAHFFSAKTQFLAKQPNHAGAGHKAVARGCWGQA